MKIELPNIAPGKWFVEHDRPGLISVSTDKSSVCSMDFDEGDKEWCELHAQAIAAVPDLLQVVADAYTRTCVDIAELRENMKEFTIWSGPDRTVRLAVLQICRDQYRDALQKAGCSITQ